MSRTWLITGASRGLGRAFTQAALARGDRVAALARNVDDLPDDAVPVHVDVTDRAAVFAAVEAATEALGTLDVVVNNAGTMSIGMVEEFDEAAAREAMETNFFGALWVSQAVAPRLREQGSGHLAPGLRASAASAATRRPGSTARASSRWRAWPRRWPRSSGRSA